MDIREILEKCDHTLLRVDCTAGEIRSLCDQAIKYNCASVCIPPAHVAGAKRYVGDKLTLCTVIGFPNGYMTSAVKAFEAADAIRNGAEEIDMVINLGALKSKDYDTVLNDIKAVRAACEGFILKVIIETSQLTEEEKVKACELSAEAKADFVKTSTGFTGGGATAPDVALMKKSIPAEMQVKASGGVRSREDFDTMVAAGATRIGASCGVKIVEGK